MFLPFCWGCGCFCAFHEIIIGKIAEANTLLLDLLNVRMTQLIYTLINQYIHLWMIYISVTIYNIVCFGVKRCLVSFVCLWV